MTCMSGQIVLTPLVAVQNGYTNGQYAIYRYALWSNRVPSRHRVDGRVRAAALRKRGPAPPTPTRGRRWSPRTSRRLAGPTSRWLCRSAGTSRATATSTRRGERLDGYKSGFLSPYPTAARSPATPDSPPQALPCGPDRRRAHFLAPEALGADWDAHLPPRAPRGCRWVFAIRPSGPPRSGASRRWPGPGRGVAAWAMLTACLSAWSGRGRPAPLRACVDEAGGTTISPMRPHHSRLLDDCRTDRPSRRREVRYSSLPHQHARGYRRALGIEVVGVAL